MRRKFGHLLTAWTENIYWNVPRPTNPYFTGRRDILTELREKLCNNDEDEATPKLQKRFIIYGIGGSGKSEVCVKFAEENRER
jgi:hypothetical protein